MPAPLVLVIDKYAVRHLDDITIAQDGGVDADTVEQDAILAVVIDQHAVGIVYAQKSVLARDAIGGKLNMRFSPATDHRFLAIQVKSAAGGITFGLGKRECRRVPRSRRIICTLAVINASTRVMFMSK
jgi:hypothetical protein